jgi:hypothetical protein
MPAPQRLLNFRLLKSERHWPYCRQHTARLVDDGRFAKPKKLPGSHLNFWTDADVDAFYQAATTVEEKAD